MVGHEHKLLRIQIGHDAADDALNTMLKESEADLNEVETGRWHESLRDRLRRFADGEPEAFDDIQVVWPQPLTRFRSRVMQAVRRVGWGQTISYGELAERAGSPRAARAVGSTMAMNRFPIVIPCHRVIQSGGSPGRFSTPRGTTLKLRMLALESPDPTRQS